MARRPMLLVTLAVALCHCTSRDPCFTTAACPTQMRCLVETSGEVGYCVACDESETPYDGIDNDCLATTPDVDQDGDGDNWDQAPFAKGTDCDDLDPTISATLDEICDDDKDNDCDGTIDEIDCADSMAPSIRFTFPLPGAILVGRVDVQVVATDDVGVEFVELVGPRGVQLGRKTRGPFVFPVDTAAIEDGPATFDAFVTDLVGLRTTARIEVVIDNSAGPIVEVIRGPTTGGRFGKEVLLELEASDPSGVAQLEVQVDGVRVASSTTARLVSAFNSGNFADGVHELAIISLDGRGSLRRTTTNVIFDNTPPSVTIDQPADGAIVSPGPVTVSVSAMDDAGILWTSVGDAGAPSETFTTTIPIQGVGLHTITASATDIVTVGDELRGNVGYRSITVRVVE